MRNEVLRRRVRAMRITAARGAATAGAGADTREGDADIA